MHSPRSRFRAALNDLRKPATGSRLSRFVDQILPPRAASVVFPAADERRTKLVVATYNVHKCVGVDGRFDPDRIAAVIAELDADIVCLQEADRRIGLRNGLLNLASLERDTGLGLIPVAARAASHGWHGNAILARNGMPIRVRRITLPYAEPRGAVMAELKVPAGQIRVIGAHLGLLKHSRRQQAAALIQAIHRAEPMPTVLMGDFNEWRSGRPDSPLGELEPFFGSAIHSLPSFPSRRPIFALDRILGWPLGSVEAVAVHETPLSRIASDHLPVKALINLATPFLANADAHEETA